MGRHRLIVAMATVLILLGGAAAFAQVAVPIPPPIRLPRITSMSPNPARELQLVVIRGNDFGYLPAGCRAHFEGGTSAAITFLSSTSLLCIVPAGTRTGIVRLYASLPGISYSSQTPLTIQLPMPTGFTATALSPSQIRLNWTYPSTWHSGFDIVEVVGGSDVLVATVAASAREYTIAGLPQLTRHGYRVRARGAVSGEHSAYTAEAAVSLPATLEIENQCRLPLRRLFLNGVEWRPGSVNVSYLQRQAVDASAGVVDVVAFFNVLGENPWFSLSQQVTIGLDRTVRITFQRMLTSIDILTRTHASENWWLRPINYNNPVTTHYTFHSDGSYQLFTYIEGNPDYTLSDEGFVTHLGIGADGTMTFLMSSTMGGPVLNGTIRSHYLTFGANHSGLPREWDYYPFP